MNERPYISMKEITTVVILAIAGGLVVMECSDAVREQVEQVTQALLPTE